MKLPEVAAKGYDGALADFDHLDKILELTKVLNEADSSLEQNSSFQHPYDLSQRHSNRPELADVSASVNDTPARRKRRKKGADDECLASSDAQSSVIASNSSFDH